MNRGAPGGGPNRLTGKEVQETRIKGMWPSNLTLFLEGFDAEYVGLVYFQGFVRRRDQVSSVRIEGLVGTEDR